MHRWCDSLLATSLLAILPHASAHAQIRFEADLAPAVVGHSPRSVTSADLDGDGDLDLAVANFGSQNMAVLLNLGGGTFAPAVGYSVGTSARYIDSGDLDGDGDVDLAVVRPYGSGHSVSVFLNTGTGTFAPHVAYLVGFSPSALTIADLDGDGDRDIAVAITTGPGGGISILRNLGSGTFQNPVYYFSGFGDVFRIASADLDGDGDIDLVTTNHVSAVSVFKNFGNGTFAAPVAYPVRYLTTTVTCADLDGDGDVDLACGCQGYRGLLVLKNAGNGTFSTFARVPSGSPIGLIHADLDGDGDVDLAATDDPTNSVSVHLNHGDGTFAPMVSYGVGSLPLSLTPIDFDGDGDTDLAVADTNGSNVLLLRNHGDGSFQTPVPTPLMQNVGQMLDCADFDGDGDPDLLSHKIGATSPGTYALSMYANQGDGSFPSHALSTSAETMSPAAAADLDGDGDRDVALLDYNWGRLSVQLNQGGGTFALSAPYALPSRSNAVVPADVDGDGDLDLIATLYPTSTLCVLSNYGNGTFAPPVSFFVGTQPGPLTSADFDADGDADLAVLADSNAVCVLLNAGHGFPTTVPYSLGISSGSAYYSGVSHADLDGDGDEDLVVGNVVASRVSVLLNQGNGTFAPHVSYRHSLGGALFGLVLADFDLDGDVDVSFTSGDSVAVLPNQGNGTFAAAVEYFAGPSPWSVKAADLDSDGDPDLVMTDKWWNGVRILRNAAVSGTTFCAGDGSGTQCPCGNNSSIGDEAGCSSSLGIGATLRASGWARLSNDGVALVSASMPSGAVMFVQGTTQQNGGAGSVLGDGLRCIGGTIVRLKAAQSVGGTSRYPDVGDLPLAVRGQITQPGTRTYQVWYRNAATFCTASTFNLTNGVQLTWSP